MRQANAPTTQACGLTIKIPIWIYASNITLPAYSRLRGIGAEQSGINQIANTYTAGTSGAANTPIHLITLANQTTTARVAIEDLGLNGNAFTSVTSGSGTANQTTANDLIHFDGGVLGAGPCE